MQAVAVPDRVSDIPPVGQPVRVHRQKPVDVAVRCPDLRQEALRPGPEGPGPVEQGVVQIEEQQWHAATLRDPGTRQQSAS